MTGLLPKWQAGCRDAITLLAEARDLPPAQVIDLTDSALRKVVAVRDSMIELLREQSGGAEMADHGRALQTINVTLSELASVEYPGLLDREHLDQAIQLLQEIAGEQVLPAQ